MNLKFYIFLLSFIKTLVVVHCLQEQQLTTLNNEKVLIVKTLANEQSGSYKTVKDTFKEVFDKLTVQVRENTPVGNRLADIQANVESATPPQESKIIYAIVGGQDQASFELIPIDYKVELISKVPFDFESPKKRYHIIIRAASLYLRYEVEVDIIVVDENDNPPQLDDFSVVINNYKNHFPTYSIGRVPAYDLDASDQLRYKILTGNTAQLIAINETSGDIQLSPWLNNNVPLNGLITIAVSDGLHEAVAQMTLRVNLISEDMLKNSVVLKLDGISREDFMLRKSLHQQYFPYEAFLIQVYKILSPPLPEQPMNLNNIVVFDVEEYNTTIPDIYQPDMVDSVIPGINVSFSVRNPDVSGELHLLNQFLIDRINSNKTYLMQVLNVSNIQFQENSCSSEQCQNNQICQAIYKFEKVPKDFITTRNMIFRPIKTKPAYLCKCPEVDYPILDIINSTVCKPCNCDESKGFDGDCDKQTGACYCKPNHYQPSSSYDQCLPCDCYSVGSLKETCAPTTGQCECRPGVVGRRCDSCSSLYAEVTQRGCNVIYNECPKTFSDGIWWDRSPLDKLATQQCPTYSSTGTATRFCHRTEGWQKANLFDCISNSFRDLYTKYEFLENNNFSLNPSISGKIASNLRTALNETQQLYGSDMFISFRLIHYLIMHETQQTGLNLTHTQERFFIKNLVESINYILDPVYAENWPEIAARSPNGGPEYLLKLLDIYGKVLIDSQAGTHSQPFEYVTKYFTFGMDISTDKLYDIEDSGPKLEYKMLEPQLQQHYQPSQVVYSILKSLGPLLPNHTDNTVQHHFGMIATSNSPIIWLTLRSPNAAKPKINYMLKMIETTGRTHPQCAIWEFNHHQYISSSSNSASNKSALIQSNKAGSKQTGRFTTKGCEIKSIHTNHRLKSKYDSVNCSCDRLGGVTVLMDTSNNYESNNTGEGLISVIAIIISLVTMCLTLFLLSCVRGHSIRSNSNAINQNLLFILIAIEFLILYNITSRSTLYQREYQCKLVAIFLQYFSISLFFWLMVNAIHFYRILTEVRDINHGPMKFYYVIGYAIPAVLVSIAVGLRIEQFGNPLFCWLSIYEPIIWSMFAPISLASAFIIIIFLLAITKSMPKKNRIKEAGGIGENDEASEGGNNGVMEMYKNHMFINIIKTPLIGLYWIIMVYFVNEVLVDYTYLSPIITVFKSIVILFLLCYLDKYIRYNIYVSWLRIIGKKVPIEIEDSMNYHNFHHQQQQPQWTSSQDQFYSSSTAMFAGNNDPYISNKHQFNPYGGYMTTTTPGFQGSCTDIFRPDVLNYSAASTTSRSTASSTTSSIIVYNNKTHSKSGGRGNKHRRRHKKSSSHHKHHHHKHHHHHHHHHRSHKNHHHKSSSNQQYEQQPLQNSQPSIVSQNNNVASSHASMDSNTDLNNQFRQNDSTIQNNNQSNDTVVREVDLNDQELNREQIDQPEIKQPQPTDLIASTSRSSTLHLEEKDVVDVEQEAGNHSNA